MFQCINTKHTRAKFRYRSSEKDENIGEKDALLRNRK
jgi:hypothetical protein